MLHKGQDSNLKDRNRYQFLTDVQTKWLWQNLHLHYPQRLSPLLTWTRNKEWAAEVSLIHFESLQPQLTLTQLTSIEVVNLTLQYAAPSGATKGFTMQQCNNVAVLLCKTGAILL